MSSVHLVERQLYSVYFKASEWSIREQYDVVEGRAVYNGKKFFYSGGYYNHRMSFLANSIDEALANLQTFAVFDGPSLEINGDLITKPRYEGIKVESVTKKAVHWVPLTESPWRGQAYHGKYSFAGNTDRDMQNGWRDNGTVSIVAPNFEEAKKIIEDYTQQEEEVTIHSIQYDGEVFVNAPEGTDA